jgi:hypothetical protein
MINTQVDIADINDYILFKSFIKYLDLNLSTKLPNYMMIMKNIKTVRIKIIQKMKKNGKV